MGETIELLSIEELIKNGGIFFNVKGDRPETVFKNILEKLSLPESVDKTNLYRELCQREELMSTAVGNGIAIPHPRYPLLTDTKDQRLVVCFLDKPVMMNPPDMRPVYVFFILLTSNTKTHLKILSQLAFLFQKPEFRHFLEQKPTEEALIKAIKQSMVVSSN
ncbi:MAG: PTS sugar transporter subunit IIA [Treponema sp.]|jgi:PTS system nitrogen regulatory IIA component|nr:PTS sugar transporter subunit IIA [Treponema sp.]